MLPLDLLWLRWDLVSLLDLGSEVGVGVAESVGDRRPEGVNGKFGVR